MIEKVALSRSVNSPRRLVARFYQSSVAWSWALNGFRLASGLLLLPLLLHVLPKADLGMYYVFLSLTALLPIIDFGFSVSISRSVSYAMGGATDLKATGLIANVVSAPSNLPLLWRLLATTRQLFAYLTIVTFLVLGLVGTFAVKARVLETSSPQQTWLAFGITVLSATLEIYSGWWNVFLRGMNEVLLSARIWVLAYALKLILAGILLLLGAGLLAWPVAGLFSSLLQRHLARRSCLRRLGAPPVRAQTPQPSLLPVLWPTSWRAGLQFFSTYLATSANGLICAKIFGLAANAEYGLSVQVAAMIQGMAMVWTSVKWPLVGQYRAQHDYARLRRLLQPRYWLQTLTFLLLALPALFVGPMLLRWHGGHNQLLPVSLLAILLANSFLELHFSFWATLLSMENRIPSLWPTVITNVVSLSFVLWLIRFSSLGIAAFVLAPFVSGCLFNYWFWLGAGARSLQTTWLRFVFGRPTSEAERVPSPPRTDKMACETSRAANGQNPPTVSGSQARPETNS